MDQINITNKNHLVSFQNILDLYLKNKPPDCILYSHDGAKFKIHREIFSQTKFLREILSSTKENCCGTLEIFCPCTEEELWYLVHFLYHGEIHCENKNESLKIHDDLSKMFGFSENLSLNNSNEARHQCSLDIDFEAEEKYEICFDQASENDNFDNGYETPVDELVSLENEINAVTITEEAFENISDHSQYVMQFLRSNSVITDENLDNLNEIVVCSESLDIDNEAETALIAARGSYK